MKTLARVECRAEILQRLKDVTPSSTRRWGRMSAHQMICHLADAFLMMTGEKHVSEAGSFTNRTIVKWIALYTPLPWPAGHLTRPEIDQECQGTCPTDFASDLAAVEAFIQSLSARGSSFDGRRHPVFGRLSQAAWLRWAYLHADHHLRQFGA
jgi:hypothetical protein